MLYLDSVLYYGKPYTIFYCYFNPDDESSYNVFRFIFFESETGGYENVAGREVINYIALHPKRVGIRSLGGGFEGYVLGKYARIVVSKLKYNQTSLFAFFDALNTGTKHYWAVDDDYIYFIDSYLLLKNLYKIPIKNHDGKDLKRSLVKWQAFADVSFDMQFVDVDFFKNKLT